MGAAGRGTHEGDGGALERGLDGGSVLEHEVDGVHLDALLSELLRRGLARVAGQAADAVRLVRLGERAHDATALNARRADDDNERRSSIINDSHGREE